MNDTEKNKNSNAITLSRTFYDLTHIISQDTPIYPGDPQPVFEPSSTIENDNYNVTRIIMGSHSSTHVDAQKHFMMHGNSIDTEPLSKFIGESIVVDLSEKRNIGEGITCSDLGSYSKVIKDNDILLLYTGTSEIGLKIKISNMILPILNLLLAQWIVDHHVKCIGIDTFSVEKYGSKEGLSHKILLSSSVGIIENLNSNLKNLIGKRVFLVCLPLLLEGVDGSPARAIAFDIV